ncbi:MAG: transglycosylase SLT domain-containing protein, partial [Chloroflexi bacterium]|nr:transglycosylase SLT domain-containing protein [Chloroflexota bacterium]
QFLLGVSYLGRKNYYEAARRLEGFVQRYTNGKWTAKGRFYLAAADLGIGAPDAAIANYELFGKLEPSMRPYMDFVIADLLKGRGNIDGAIQRLLPNTKDDASAIRGQAMERLADLYSSIQRPVDAAKWYESALNEAQGSAKDQARLRFALGRAYFSSGNLGGALAQFVTVLRQYPASKEALSARTTIIQLAGRSNDAVAAYDKAANDYTQAANWAGTRFQLGLSAYERNDFQTAANIWRSAAEDPGAPTPRDLLPKMLMWAGRAEIRRGNGEEAKRLWSKALEINPEDYYSLRAEDWLNASSGKRVAATFNGGAPTAAQKKEMTEWLASLPQRPVAASEVGQMKPYLEAEPAAKRAMLLLDIGLRNEGGRELQRLAEQFAKDPSALYQIGAFAQEKHLYELAMSIGNMLRALVPNTNTADLPTLVQQLLFPLAYNAIVGEEVKKFGVDPYLLLALMRQESVYNKDVFSHVGAAGLTQVMPATGQEIAKKLSPSGFSTADLLQPTISIRFGAWYLAQQLAYFNGDPFFALAAYNGGAGNVNRWRAGAAGYDDDLFVEKIGFQETQTYVKKVYAYYRLYQRSSSR